MVAFDIPGVTADAIDIDVERNTLTVKAERGPVATTDDVKVELSQRPLGVSSRQIVLADTLDTEHIQADYDACVRTLRIPIAERAKPRRSPSASDPAARRSPADTGPVRRTDT